MYLTQSRTPYVIEAIFLAALVALGPTQIYPVFLMKVMCFALFSSGYNLLIGYGGLLSLGHAMFFGSAAYLCGYLAKDYGWPPELAIVTAVAFATVLGAAVGWLSIRRRGIFFAMSTLAFAQMVYFICLRLPQTGGENGLQNVPRHLLLGLFSLDNPLTLYLFESVLFLAGMAFYFRLIYSPFGAALRAIRENDVRATSLGYATESYRLLAFTLSAAFAGLAGAMKVFVFQLATLTDVDWQMSGEVVLMVLLGGIGTVIGPAVGALVMLTIEQVLAERAGSWIGLIQGSIFVGCVLVFRRGIVGEIGNYLKVNL
jgi:branched-chain amino acid transport system permease protein